MKMKISLLLIILISLTLHANPKTKSDELCNCLKKAKSTNNDRDKSACLSLREKHVKALKKGSKNHEKYLENMQVCERELSDLPSVDANLSLDEKIQKVCDCFQNSEKSNRFTCFKLQSDYAKTISASDEKQRFTDSSNSCDK